MLTEGIVQRTIRTANRNVTLWGVIGLALVIVALVASAGYLGELFGGPYELGTKTLLEAASADDVPHQYVTVTGDDTLDTGYEYIETNTRTGSERVEASYVALVLDDRLLLVETSGDLTAETFTGMIQPISAQIQREIINDIVRDEPDLEGVFLPYMLSTTFDAHGPVYAGIVVGVVVVALAVWNLFRVFRRRGNPAMHPIMKSLARFGDADHAAQQIELEADQAHQQVGKLRLLRNWLLLVNRGNLQATRMKDVVWLYMKVTQHRTNGIPTGKTYEALIYDRHGEVFTISGKQAGVDDMLHAVQQRAPWAIVGYSEQIMNIWKKERAQLIAEVDRRMSIVQAAANAPQAQPQPAASAGPRLVLRHHEDRRHEEAQKI